MTKRSQSEGSVSKPAVGSTSLRSGFKFLSFEGRPSASRPHRTGSGRGLEAKKSRAIDLHEGDVVDEAAFKALVRAATALRAKR